MATKVFEDTFKGHPFIAIWKVDSDGNKIGKTPIVSFGKVKCQAIMEHQEEIGKWLERQKETVVKDSSGQIDCSRLSPAQISLIKAVLEGKT